MPEYTIGDLVDATGVNRRNIYFYVQQGLLPPPEGAGLGARYGDEHLLRLRAIPVLRSQGLRLDEIRERLAGLNLRSLRALLDEAPKPAVLAPKSNVPGAAMPSAKRLTRYTLATGVDLFVEAGVESIARTQVAELIQAAQKILRR
jgi:Ca-activated chloride channel family protein